MIVIVTPWYHEPTPLLEEEPVVEYETKPKKVWHNSDGGTYTDFGGPCGPIYTDRNGDA